MLRFLQGTQQFVIPIYQRTYSWTRRQCQQLWNDIVRAATDDAVPGHFVGSVVYIERGLYQISSVPQLLVIDGQQRLTTVSLLLAALGRALNDEDGVEITRKRIANYYLVNSDESGELRHKLLLTQSDRGTLLSLVEGTPLPLQASPRMLDNFQFFEAQLRDCDLKPAIVHRGIAKLMIVDIALDRDHDNPQLIFESLNSTGLALTQADLIRNYVLMRLDPNDQEDLYNHHWYPMEQTFGHVDYTAYFDRFMRDYLTVKTGRIPNIDQVYQSFKEYSASSYFSSVSDMVADVHKFSDYFVRMAFGKEADNDVARALTDINELRVDVCYPFLLEVYSDWEADVVGTPEVTDILRLLESYVFRRAICGIPTNSLNKTFQNLAGEIDKSNYLESFKAALLTKDGNRRFPRDEEFMAALQVKDVYNLTNRRNYLLRKLENYDRKELVDVESYTIEHVMPQNDRLSEAWRAELGPDWQEVQAKYLHTIGNLTLTGYNAELSDRPFTAKRDMKGGFADSPIRLNRHLAQLEHWNEQEIDRRSGMLAKLAISVWPTATIAPEILKRYVEKSPDSPVYTLTDHPYLTGQILELFEQLRKRVRNLDASVSEEILKLYVAYKTSTNFVDVVPQKSGLRLSLNMDFAEIDDPSGMCRDVTNLGRWGNGDVEVGLSSVEELEYVMFLIRQAFDKHAENGY